MDQFARKNKNVHVQLKELSAEAMLLTRKIRAERPAPGPPTTNVRTQTAQPNNRDGNTQTSPLGNKLAAPGKRKPGSPCEGEQDKRPRKSGTRKLREAETPKIRRVTSGIQEKTPTNTTQCMHPRTPGDYPATKGPKTDGNQWVEVIGRKAKAASATTVPRGRDQDPGPRSKKRPRPAPPDAIVVRDKTGTYADILRKVKTSINPDAIGATITAVRRTREGDLLLQMGRGCKATPALQDALRSTLGEGATVRTLQPHITLEVRDIDEATGELEVREAATALITKEGGTMTEMKVTLRPAYRGTQLAIIHTTMETGQRLLKEGRLKIGWINARVRRRPVVLKCYRCQGFGHRSHDCKSGKDRSSACRRCSKDGHKAAECNAPPRCRAAQDLVLQTAREEGADVLLLSEHNRSGGPDKWSENETASAAIVVLNSEVPTRPGGCGEGFVWRWIDNIRAYSCYFSPNVDSETYASGLDQLEASIRSASGDIYVAGDFNAKNVMWGSTVTDSRGLLLMEMAARLGLLVLNRGSTPTWSRPHTGSASVIDVIFANERLARCTLQWMVSDRVTLSDHRYIIFKNRHGARDCNKVPAAPRGWNAKRMNKAAFGMRIREEAVRICTQKPADPVSVMIAAIGHSCDSSMPRRVRRTSRRPVFWWSQTIADLRSVCLRARRKAQRASRADATTKDELLRTYKMAKKNLTIEIKRSKEACWKDLLTSVEADPWGLPYRIVMKRLGGHQIPATKDPEELKVIIEDLFPNHGT
ncbi:uncharacterized protein LOC107274591, partial [Cephus cinctus]|uniref:Uncharacterized protein LOC107274591 n=1 Tax=Cephus cinctus TaxID=211228 RepID=A0AAJ7CGB6_CEPCN